MKGYLVLANGKVFEGERFGATGEVLGELVFTTSMTGYLETLTDPSYYGQMVLQTFPLIGNYGVIPEDFESERPQVKAYIVRQMCEAPSNFRSLEGLEAFLCREGIVGLSGVDTRAITRVVREAGVMNAWIADTPTLSKEKLAQLKTYQITEAVASVGGGKQAAYPALGAEKYHVALWDFGAKHNIIRSLQQRGCRVTVVPAATTAAEITALHPDGVMLSNGPGDPAENGGIIHELSLLGKTGIPVFGICLGHQLLALAQGGQTGKLKYGHRGANQPAKDVKTGRVYITSQNHGYAVVNDSLPNTAAVRFINGNDGTCEGVEYYDMPAFSVQFHPEAFAGPRDTAFLFDWFLEMMEGGRPYAAQ